MMLHVNSAASMVLRHPPSALGAGDSQALVVDAISRIVDRLLLPDHLHMKNMATTQRTRRAMKRLTRITGKAHQEVAPTQRVGVVVGDVMDTVALDEAVTAAAHVDEVSAPVLIMALPIMAHLTAHLTTTVDHHITATTDAVAVGVHGLAVAPSVSAAAHSTL